LLDLAIKHKTELESIQYNIWLEEKYKYYNCDTYYDSLQIDESTWQRHQFVSVKSGEVIGYISYRVDRTSDMAHSLAIMNFTDDKITFGIDLGRALTDIFEKYNFRKLEFSVVVGNPIEISYDNIIKRYGGRIIGTHHKQCRLIDSKLYDLKEYEIFKEDYMKNRRTNK
jgi:hypothetical protein